MQRSMKQQLPLLFLVLTITLHGNAQNKGFAFGTRVQLSTGAVLTMSNEPTLEVSVNREIHVGLQQGLQVSFFAPVSNFNIGIGGGLSFRTGDTIYNSSLSPKVFFMFEFGNGKKRTLLSYILNIGVMKGSIENKACFYFGGGPSFNIGKEFSLVTVSINPYWEFHMGESGIRYIEDPHSSPYYQNYIDYTLQFRTATVNLSCIVQFNFDRKAKK